MTAEATQVFCPDCQQMIAVVSSPESVWAALEHHTCTPASCDICTDVAFLLDTGETDTDAVSRRLSRTPAAIEKHLYRHRRRDLIARITTPPRGTTMSTPALRPVPDAGKRPHPKDLLDHADKRIARAAAKVMDAIGKLDAEWEANAAKAELRAKRDRLKKQLAAVESQLRGAPTVSAPARDWKAVRDWAAAQGLDCPVTGKVPNAIVDAFDQAHG